MIILKISHPEALVSARKTILNNGLIAFPTDTVYGVAASAFDPVGIDKIYMAKNRSPMKSLPVLIGCEGQLDQIASIVTPLASRLIGHYWPGALTIIVKRNPALPSNISTDQTVGVRMPNYKFAIELLNATGPLATTSANQSGQSESLTADDVKNQIGEKIDLLLDGGKVVLGVPSTVVDCTKEIPVILRAGAIPTQSIMEFLNR